MAKEIKIKTLKKQREFIEQEISTMGIQDNAGNAEAYEQESDDEAKHYKGFLEIL
ncbi:MAG TPA: hypothetical protein OIM45_05100 [Clostridiaceae bacterium]|nr:hypothetical protein [Clostridiaceae bacterium]